MNSFKVSSNSKYFKRQRVKSLAARLMSFGEYGDNRDKEDLFLINKKYVYIFIAIYTRYNMIIIYFYTDYISGHYILFISRGFPNRLFSKEKNALYPLVLLKKQTV